MFKFGLEEEVHGGIDRALSRPYRAQNDFVQDQGFREALHPWLSCGRSVGALLSGPGRDELIVPSIRLLALSDLSKTYCAVTSGPIER